MEEIAITGVSGRFPKCDSVDEFRAALLSGDDLITDDHKRWPYKFLKTPPSLGILECWDLFDAPFFSLNQKQVDEMDPRTRQILEVCYECILDAGINPIELKGSKTGVFLGASENFSSKGIMNRLTAVMANTISYVFDLKAPSCAIDTGCSSSIYIMNQAIDSIKSAACEAAIVCAAQNHLDPDDSIVMTKMGVLSQEGRCRTFDSDRNGYVKSEAVVAVLLQKQTNARRIYATVAGIACNVDGYKASGIHSPSSESQTSLLRDVYDKFNIDTDDVGYIETHGTGTVTGDLKECQAIGEVFRVNTRNIPLKIGSVKTMIGHTESAAGLVSLVKLFTIIQTDIIPGNLHFNNPADDILEIRERKLEVVNKNTAYDRKLLAVSSFGIGGANGHMVIRPFYRDLPDLTTISPNQQRLVVVSGRTYNAVETLLETIELHETNNEFLSLISKIFEKPILNHEYRGYTILNRNFREVEQWSKQNRPIWFSFSGMGSQWPQMGKELMYFKIFKDSVKKCAAPLKCYGIDLEDILINGTEETLNDPEQCFPAIITVSVGLTDILYSLGVRPEGIIGHSLGEIGCAYADGVITAEQAVLIAHARGFATNNTKLIPGLMASVGIGLEECISILPNDIYIACVNSDSNITISGPEESVKNFVEYLDQQNIFVKIVNTANVAFHSRYIHDVGPLLLEMLRKIVPTPRERSRRWLSSAVPEKEYSSYLGKVNSAEYHHHNFMNPVLFNQVMKKIPRNAILIEVAPRGLFQAIFKRSLSSSIENITLISRDLDDNIEFLLSSIGRIYLCGENAISLNGIFPEVNFPVDCGTPTISSLIKWEHSKKWYVPFYDHNVYDGQKIWFDLNDKKNEFLFDYRINEVNVFPRMGYVYLAWEALANINMVEVYDFSVKITDIKFVKTVEIPLGEHLDYLKFSVNILRSGQFEIWHEDCIVCFGNVFILETSRKWSGREIKIPNEMKLMKGEFYKELEYRGYDLTGVYKNVVECDITGKMATIQWKYNWIALLESIFQVFAVGQYTQLTEPKHIAKLEIIPTDKYEQKPMLYYNYEPLEEVADCGGVKIEEIKVEKITQIHETKVHNLLKYSFIRNSEDCSNEILESQLENSLRISLKIVIENNLTSLVTNVAEYVPNYTSRKLSIATQYYRTIVKVVHKKHFNSIRYTKIGNLSLVDSNINFLLVPHTEANSQLPSILLSLTDSTFVFTKIRKGHVLDDLQTFISEHAVFKCFDEQYVYVLLKKTIDVPDNCIIINSSNGDFNWIKTLQKSLIQGDKKIYLTNEDSDTGILGLFNCLHEELRTYNLRIFILDPGNTLDLTSDFYTDQIKKDLSVNVLNEGIWGTYRVLPVEPYFHKTISSWEIKLNTDVLEIIELNPYISSEISILYLSLFKWSDSEESYYGFEYSGVDSFGQKVIGLCPKENPKSHCSDNSGFVWKLPTYMNDEKAAGLPLCYAMAYYGLFLKTKVRSTKNVLIMGTSNLCLASINLALNSSESNVYVITLNENESFRLVEEFPNLIKENIFNCQQEHLATNISTKINFKELDIVLYECETFIYQSRLLKLIQSDVTIIDINLKNKEVNGKLINDLFAIKCTIISVRPKDLFQENNINIQKIKTLFQSNLDRGLVKYFDYELSEIANIETIFNNIQCHGETQEKIIIQIKGHEKHMYDQTKPRIYFPKTKSYIILEKYTGYALQLAKFLISRGATNIILNTMSNVSTGYQEYCLNVWNNKKINVTKTNFDISKYNECEDLIKLAESFGPIGGIFTFTISFENKLFTDLTVEDFAKSVTQKLSSAQNLDTISRRCNELDYFVIFSSTTSLGYAGQANCSYAATALENVCRRRRKDNFPAVNIHWETGFSQSISDNFDVMDEFLQRNETVLLNADVFEEEDVNIDEKETDIVKVIINILGVDNWEELDDNITLQKLGMDSISFVDIKHTLLEKLGINLSPVEIRKLTIRDLENFDKSRMLESAEQ